jgi:hypothetical protein
MYTRDTLKKFGMDKAKPVKTPMGTNGHLDLDMGGTLVDQKVYRSIISYLPNIMLSVYISARFQATPKECHLRVVKRIMRYLVLTPKLAYGILRVHILSSLDIQISTMPDAKLIERVPPRLANFLDGP